MYTFQIESIHDKNRVLENKMVDGNKVVEDNKMVGGGGKQFKVYRASDINKLFGDNLTKDNYRTSIQAFTDTLMIDQLFDYYFCYIIYDTFDKDLFRSFFFTYALQASIEKKLLIIQDIQKKNTDSESKVIQYEISDDRSSFCRYILNLFDIKSGQQTVQLPYADFLDQTVIVLSEGQYLNHIDLIYSKYSLIIQNYKDHIDDIETYGNTETYDNTDFVAKYNGEKQEIIKKYTTYVDKKEIPDEKYIVLHLLFLFETYIDKNSGVTEAQPKSYLLLIDEKYAKLEVIKDQNLFYNTNKMFIRNKAEFLEAIKLKIQTDFKTLSAHNGIEKLLNIYYAYIPHESSKDDKVIHEVFSDLCMKISDFFITNKNIYNLLLFNDTIFFKMIKDDLILTLYDLEKQFEHKFGFVRAQEDSIHFDIQQGFTLDTEYIKQMMLYRYKQLEQTIRRLYLDQYAISAKKITVTGTITGTTSYSAPKFYEVIQMRRKKLNIGFALWTAKQSRYLTRMINVIDFYRIGRLVEYLVLPDITPREGVESASDRYVGVITKITGLTYTMKRLSQISLSQIPLSVSDDNDSIGIDNIRETEYILCDEVIASANIKESTAWAPSACDSEDLKIKYRDIDLFDPIYDIEIYTILPGDIKLKLTETPKCLVLRSAIIVDHKHRKKQTMQFAQDRSIAEDTYSEDFEETIDLDTETYVSVYTIKDKNSLTLLNCFSVCDTKLRRIEETIIVDSMKTYMGGELFCFLIEKVSNGNIVQTRYPCDILFFIDEPKKQQILDVINPSK